MSELRIYAEDAAADAPLQVLTRFEGIRRALADIDIDFERWPTRAELADDAAPETVLAAYAAEIESLNRRYGFKSVDVVGLYPDHPEREAMRAKFLHEHTHDDFEIRFFVDGQGLFYIRKGGKVYGMLCERDDLISVPPDTTHWFDMGPRPFFKAIRFFLTEDGWVGKFTGDKIADRFPRLENPG